MPLLAKYVSNQPPRPKSTTAISPTITGEMAEALLLSGQRAVPAKAERLGFQFEYPELEAALRAILEV